MQRMYRAWGAPCADSLTLWHFPKNSTKTCKGLMQNLSTESTVINSKSKFFPRPWRWFLAAKPSLRWPSDIFIRQRPCKTPNLQIPSNTFKYLSKSFKSRNLTAPSGIETGIIRSTVRIRSKTWAVLLCVPMQFGHICERPGNNNHKTHIANTPKSAWQLHTITIAYYSQWCFGLNLLAEFAVKPISFLVRTYSNAA